MKKAPEGAFSLFFRYDVFVLADGFSSRVAAAWLIGLFPSLTGASYFPRTAILSRIAA